MLFFIISVVGNDVFMLGGVDSDTATTCAEGLYILNTGVFMLCYC